MLICRNVHVGQRRTSIRLERELWDAVNEVCTREGMTLHELCTLLDRYRGASSLTAALRVFLIVYFRRAATEEGHAGAGHGVSLPQGQGSDRWRPILASVFGNH